ncbi:MAG: tyrosine-protein phosphatase [Actinomycetota bacterium]|nr:tyrosine-protein phosphatase [Actinomycetota bacterium]
MSVPHWLDLDGTSNTRDVGGLPLGSGGVVCSGRLLRSDNLQALSPADVHRLVVQCRLQTVIDLRTTGEVTHEGPTALSHLRGVAVHHLSLFPEPVEPPEANRRRSAAELVGGDTDTDAAVVLPWQDRASERAQASARTTYLRYLQDRPDSAVTAVRLVAHTNGASLIHCAAGKDRTGVIVALALSEVGVDRDAIVTDYAATGERVQRVLARLAASPTYARDEGLDDVDRHRPRPATMRGLLEDLDIRSGGPSAWLRANGWTDEDAAALRRSLVGPPDGA